jgi:hypothetical protein
MAPEQVRGEPADARTDIYALGMILYTLMAGRPAFTGDPLSVLYRQVNEPPAPLRDLNPQTPDALAEVVATSLAKSPADRFGSAEALAHALRAALRLPDGEAPAARSASPPPTAPAPTAAAATPLLPASRSDRVGTAVMGTLVSLLSLGIVGAVGWTVLSDLLRPEPVPQLARAAGSEDPPVPRPHRPASPRGPSGVPPAPPVTAAPATVPLGLPLSAELAWRYSEVDPASGDSRVVEEQLVFAPTRGAQSAWRLASSDRERPSLIAALTPRGLTIFGELRPESRSLSVRFDPPFTMFPDPLPLDRPVAQEFAIVAWHADQQVVGRGRVTLAIQAGAGERATPAGRFRAYPFTLTEEFSAPTPAASLRRERAGWLAPGTGIIQERVHTTRGDVQIDLERVLIGRSF